MTDPDSALVTTGWLAERLDDPAVRILETAQHPLSYFQAHLPGAAYVPYPSAFMMERDGVPGQLPTPEVMLSVLGLLGITPQTTVVLYGDPAKGVTRALWALRSYGHHNTFILDGGKPRWQREGRPLTREQPHLTTTDYGDLPAPHLDGPDRAEWETVLAGIDDPDVVLLDVRRLSEYDGSEQRAIRAGHIPGAVHRAWDEGLEENGSYRLLDALRQEVEALGVTPDKTIITYCQGGVRATHTWFVLKYLLGYPSVKNYDGSWAEWGNRPDLPVES